MHIYQAFILGLLQGISELFPISSLGHSIIIPKILGWHIEQNNPYFLNFLVVTHIATALVLFFFFFKDWKLILFGIFRSFKMREIKETNTYDKLGWLLVVGTIPAGLLGLLFEKSLKNLFSDPSFVSYILILNGLLLLGAEILKRRKKEINTIEDSDKRLAHMTWSQSFAVGILQSIALLPGFSRTGAAMTGGLAVGLSHEDSARYSFLLATPIIAAAGLLKIPELAVSGNSQAILTAIIGGISAGVAAFFTVKFLVKYFQTKNLVPFAIYCIIAGILAVLYINF